MKTDKKEIKEMLRNYWFLDEKDQEKVKFIARVVFHDKYGED